MYPRYSKLCSEKGFVNIDNGSRGDSHWTCFIKKITNHTTFTRLEELLIKFYSIKNLNQKHIIILNFRI